MSRSNLFRRTVLALGLGLCVASAQAASLRLQILHASDLEGGVGAVNDAPNFAAAVDALERDAAAKGVLSIVLSAGDNHIPGPFFSAAGDGSVRPVLRSVLGNPSAREAVGRVDLAIMNVIGFDASALGNHEFDSGTGVVAEIIGADIRDANRDGLLDEPRWLGADFPFLSSNLDFSADPALSRLFSPELLENTQFASPLADLDVAASRPKLAAATLVERNGELIGVVGATTPLLETISSPGDTRVREPGAGSNDMAALASLIQPEIDRVLLAGADKVILVTHLQQIGLEEQLVQLLRGVDVAIAGGSDTLLADADDRLRAGDTAVRTYPIVTLNADGDPVLVVSTDGQYSYVGRLVVDFDDAGKVIPGSIDSLESGAFATDEQGVNDLWGMEDAFAPGSKGAKVRALTDAVRDIVLVKDGNVFGGAQVFLEGRRTAVRTEETNMGNLTADANLFLARTIDPAVAVSHKNGGGIRAEIGSIDGITGELLPTAANPESGKAAGEISQLDIENSLRFNNGLSLVTVTAEQLRAVLEHAVAETGPGATPGRFAQLGGIAFSFDPALPAGARVRSAAIKNEAGESVDLLVADGAVVGDPVRPIRMVTLNFLASGGDGYPFPGFHALDPVFFDRVDLLDASVGASGFAPAGSEQDALAVYLRDNAALGRLRMSNATGDLDGDGDFDEIHAFGARSFSIWRVGRRGGLELTYDSAAQIEQITAALLGADFNSNNDENGSFDARSDDKGPEPEGVTVGTVRGRTYAFVGLERVGGVMVFDVSTPSAPVFVQYINNRDFSADAASPEAGDLGPEGLLFIDAANSPIAVPLLVVTNEVSGTTTVYRMD